MSRHDRNVDDRGRQIVICPTADRVLDAESSKRRIQEIRAALNKN